MRAIWLKELGGPDVLVPGDALEPVPGDGQVVVQVAFTNLTFIETQMRSGRMPAAADFSASTVNPCSDERRSWRLPRTPHRRRGVGEHSASDAG